MKQRVRWLRLELEGFGVWRDAVRFSFPPGLGALCLPNERGKTTMAAGLRAVLFGLSGESDPSRPGIGRYRSWNGPGRCHGRLDLQVEQRPIRIIRDFVTHETTVAEVDRPGDTPKILFQGNANPGGRSPSATAYRALLRELLGDLSDQELFEAFFVIGQEEIPEGRMSEALRKLVSGVGRVGGEEARAILFQEVKTLTRATGDLGLLSPGSDRPTNQRKDGEIERLEREISEMEGRRREVALSFETLVRLEEDLAQAEQEEREAVREEEHARADLAAVVEYRAAAEALERERAAHDDLLRVRDAYDQRMREADGDRARLATELADLADAPGDLERALEEASAAEVAAASLREEEARLRSALDERTALLEEQEKLSATASALRRLEDPVGSLARARAAAERWIQDVEGCREARTRLSAILEERRKLDAVASLPPETRDRLLRLDEVVADLESRATLEEQLSAARRAGKEDFDRRRQEFQERWADLSSVDAARFLAILERRAGMHRRIREIEEDLRKSSAGEGESESASPRWRWGRALAIALPLALGVVLVAVTIGKDPAAGVAGGLAILLLLGYLLARPGRPVRAPGDPRPALEREAQGLRGRLQGEAIPPGPWLPDDEGLVERAGALFRRRHEEAASLAATAAALGLEGAAAPAPANREGWDAAREEIARTARSLEESTGLSASDAVRAWIRLESALAEARERFRSASRGVLGGEGADAEGADSSAAGGIASDADPLEAPLTALRPPWEALLTLVPMLSGAPEKISGLEGALRRLTPEDWRSWEEAARDLAEARASRGAAEASWRGVERRRAETEERLGAAMVQLGEERIAASGGSLARLRERIRMRDACSAAISGAERAAAELLTGARGGPFADREALLRALALADERRRDAQQTITRSTASSELAASYARLDPAGQDRMRRDLEAMGEQARSRREALERAASQKRMALEAWKPQAQVNLAACDLELAARRREREHLCRRRDAAAAAWHLLGEAIQEFQSTHREELERSLDTRFRSVTGRAARRIRIGLDLEISLLDEGASFGDERLSQGARDQLAFCLRLAVADLVAGEIVVPMILDDPFVHSDAERLERIREALEAAAQERQILLLTHDARLAGWGSPVTAEALTSPSPAVSP